MAAPAAVPQDLGSLLGTMTPDQVITAMQAADEQARQAAAQRVAEASQAAGQTQQQYGQAAAQGPQDLAPGAIAVPELLGNLASVISGNQDYQKNAVQSIREQRQQLRQATADNLKALHDTYAQKAIYARQLGDQAAEDEARNKQLVLGKRLDLLLHQQAQEAVAKQHGEDLKAQRQSHLDEIAARGAEARQTKEAGAKDAADNLDAAIEGQIRTDSAGNRYVDLSEFTAKERSAVMKAAAGKVDPETGKPLLALRGDESKSLQALDHAAQNIDMVRESIKTFAPKDWRGRPIQAAKIKWQQIVQSNPEVASYPALQLAAINNMIAQIPPGRGFRVNKAEIARSINNDFPKATDALPVALRKLQHQTDMLENLRNTITVRNRSTLRGGVNQANARGAPAAQPGGGRFGPETVPVGQ